MTRYMYLDAAAILVQLILIFNTFYRKMYIRKNGKLFLLNTLVCMFASIFDIFSAFPNLVGFDGSYFCSTWYFIFRAFMPVTYLLYTIEFVDPRREKSRSNRFFILLLLPYFVLLLLIIINPSLPHSISIFYYEIINGVITYFRGPLIYLIYAISIFYIVLVLAYIVIYSKFFNLPELVALVSIIPLSIASVIIQFLNKNLLIELFTSTLALILVQSVIERKEKLLDPRTGLRNKNIFLDHIKRSYAFKRQCYIISITISNFNEIFNIFSYDGANNYINTITHTLDKKYRDYNQNYYTYCIDNGIYAIVIDKLYDAKQIAKQILNDMSYNEMVISKYHPKLSICIIDSPNDFESYDTLDRFITRYHSNFKNDNQILFML